MFIAKFADYGIFFYMYFVVCFQCSRNLQPT